jgi:hypothetical protein
MRLAAEPFSLNVDGRQEVTTEVSIPRDSLPANVCGIATYLTGTTSTELDANASVYFDVKTDILWTGLSAPQLPSVSDPEMLKLLNDVVEKGLVDDPYWITDEQLYHLERAGQITLPQSGAGISHGTTDEDANWGDASPEADNFIGQPCLPDDSPPGPGISCQATGEWTVVPARIVNAHKGDIILTAKCDMIGALLRTVDPKQHYTHAGIMTNNFFEVRHSTTSDLRYQDYPVGIGGMPTDGFQPDVVKYGWPGTITQSIDEAFNGAWMQDPASNKQYWIESFSASSARCAGDTTFHYPLVVKPPPGHDASVRDQLHAAAEAAKNINGHYRLYAYSDGAISEDPSYNAPVGVPARSSWAEETAATVCSTFIWTALRQVGIELEGSDLEDLDIEAGAERDELTPEGMYYYTSEERYYGGLTLYDYIFAIAHETSGFWGDLLTDASDDIATQMVNCFAGDKCNAKDDKTYFTQSAVPAGRTVSPDDILKWDSPETGGVYGYSEPLIYRPATYVPVTEWRATDGAGTITGQVLVPSDARKMMLVAEGPEATSAPGVVPDNLALAINGGVAFTSSDLGSEINAQYHIAGNLNDGFYGNEFSWIGGDTNPFSPVQFAGIDLGPTPVANIQSIAFGRSNVLGGDAGCGGAVCMDRLTGLYTLQYTRVPAPSTDLALETTGDPETGWVDIGTAYYADSHIVGTLHDRPWLRHRYDFAPVDATGFRILVPRTGRSAGTAIDEIELYDSPLRELEPVDVTVAGLEVLTDSDGNFTFNSIPAGTYELMATTHIDGVYYSASEMVTIENGQAAEVNLVLQLPPSHLREVAVDGHMFIVDDETWPASDETKNVPMHTLAYVNPWRSSEELNYEACVGDEVRVEVDINIRAPEFVLQAGDSNLDREFNSSDLVMVFVEGKYETGEAAGWEQGDWSGDGLFDSNDLVHAFTNGNYEQGPYADLNDVTLVADVAARLYEGTDCFTNDLEDTWTGTVTIPENETRDVVIRLENPDLGVPDSADIFFTLANSPVGVAPRQVAIEGNMAILDDEPWPWSDVLGTFQLSDLTTLNSVYRRELLQFEECVGDEVRVQVDLVTHLKGDNVTLVVDVYGKLFEGTSCGNSDLEDTWTDTVTIPEGELEVVSFHLESAGAGGGDWADVSLILFNVRL